MEIEFSKFFELLQQLIDFLKTFLPELLDFLG